MRTAKIALIISAVLILFTACSGDSDKSLMTVNKDGTIKSYMVEEFSESYYDAEELRESVAGDISYFNEKYESDVMELTEFEYAEGILKASMWYYDAKAYEDYNEEVFYSGKITDSLQEEYDLDVAFFDVKDLETKLQFEDIKNGENSVLIFSEPVNVKLPEKVLYISEGLKKGRSSKDVTVTDDTKEIYCIIYE